MNTLKKYVSFAVILFWTFFNFQVDGQGIHFLHNLDSALSLAKAQRKDVFVDFYTSWCAPCKTMSKEVFPQEKVGTFFNSQFINCKVQCDDKGIGKKMAEKYQIHAYPTLMFLNADGDLIHSTAGGISGEELIDLAGIARNPEHNLLSMLTQWNNGKRDTAFVNKYFTRLKSAYRIVLAKNQFEEYFHTLPRKEKTSKNTFKLIKLLGFSPFSPMLDFVETNKTAYNKSVGEQTVTKYLLGAYTWSLRGMALEKGDSAYKEYLTAKSKFKAKRYSDYEEVEMFLSSFETFHLPGGFDIVEYQKRGTAFLDKYGKNNDFYTVSLASLLGNCTGGKNEGTAGIQWMENLLARKRTMNYLNIYFYVLWRNYQFEKAIAIGEEMKASAIRENKPYKDIDSQIAMVKNLQIKKSKK